MSWKNRNLTRAFGALLLVLTSFHTNAAEQTRAHEAHEHGRATLDIVIEGNDLLIALEVPSANVVGFEHLPETEAQHHAISDARATFGDASELFIPSAAADCVVEDVHLDFANEDERAHGDESSGHEEEVSDGDLHDHSAEAKAEDEPSHSELAAEYHFHCDSPGELTAVTVKLFDYLLSTETIRVNVVAADYQKALDLHPEDGETVNLGE